MFIKVIPKGEIYIIKFFDIRTVNKIKSFIMTARTSSEKYTRDQISLFKNMHFFDNESQNNLFFKYYETLVPPFHYSKFPIFSSLKSKKPRSSLKLTSEAFNLENNKNEVILNQAIDWLHDTTINLDKIVEEKDQRTTIMIRNIPNRYTQGNMVDIININFKGLYDFIYTPTDNMVMIY